MFLRKELSRELVSSWVCRNTKFAFFISSFLAGKEAKEAGGTYEWFPLDPFSTFDGDAVPLDSPCSGGGAERFSSGDGADGTARATFHRRAGVVLGVLGRVCVSHQAIVLGWGGEGAGKGCRFWLFFGGRMGFGWS